MPKVNSKGEGKSGQRLFLQILNFIAIGISVALLVGFLVGFITRAFAADFGLGLRSLSASVLPLIVISFITFYSRIFRLPERIPVFNFYFLFTVWTVTLFLLIQSSYESLVPIPELLLAFTLALLITIYGNTAFRVSIASAYGVLSGFLLYFAIFGSPLS